MMRRDLPLPVRIGIVIAAIIGILAVITVVSAPDMEAIHKILWMGLLVILGAAVYRFPRAFIPPLILVSIFVMVAVNWSAFSTNVGGAITWIWNVLFFPHTVVNYDEVIVCFDHAACSGIYPIIYSAVFVLVLITGFAYTALLERRLLAWIQHRVGPNRVGPAGLLQPLADGLKLIFKEDIMPDGVDVPVYRLAPMLKMVPILLVAAVIPLGPDLLVPWFDGNWYQVPLGLADPSVGILWFIALTSIATYGVVLAGWSSNNKYSMLGALRASAQMISYELSFSLVVAVPVIIVGSMSIGTIIDAQSNIWNWFVFQNPLAAGILIIAVLAETSRSPFDLPEAEQELTQGYMTEYSGMKFALFMMAEYVGMIAVSMIVISLFFGGYHLFPVDGLPILGPLVMIGKVFAMLAFMIWVRGTLPRLRYDRLMAFGWKVMLPLSLLAVAWTAVSTVIADTFTDPLAYPLASTLFFLVVLIGAIGFLSKIRQAFWLIVISVIWFVIGWTVGDHFIAMGGFGTLVLVCLFILVQHFKSQEDEERGLADDPMITGERGIGWVLLHFVGILVAIPIAIIEWNIKLLEGIQGILSGPGEDAIETTDSTVRQSGGD